MKKYGEQHRHHIALAVICFVGALMPTSTWADDLPTCQAHDFHYEYTECDSEGGRWRVSVPKPGVCSGGAPNPPVRGKGCDFTCEAGEYLDLTGDQECHPCPTGTYSLGDGVRFDDWDHLPVGFSTTNEDFSLSHGIDYNHRVARSNCSNGGWIPSGKYISASIGECSTILTYTVNLVKAGSIRFEYQYVDTSGVFHFQVQNSKCQTVSDHESDRYPKKTEENEWKVINVNIKSGMNVLVWKVYNLGIARYKMRQPVLVRDIEIYGVAYTSECTKCREGHYSGEGASFCRECEANTYSLKGAASCSSCDTTTHFSDAGAGSCSERPPCTKDDYFSFYTPCDANNKTKKQYDWTTPQICQASVTGSVALPPFTEEEECPPCNLGMKMSANGTCQFCEGQEYSDGRGTCSPCPATTAPERGVFIQWWNNLPENANISTVCMGLRDRTCKDQDAWQPAMDHTYTAQGFGDDAFLLLMLDVGGFLPSPTAHRGANSRVGQVSFVFESLCAGDCSFFFMMKSKVTTDVIETWTGNTPQTKYTYNVVDDSPIQFVWAFQKVSHLMEDDVNGQNDMVKIYVINVTNTIEGGAGQCTRCPKGASEQGCIPCPGGHYVDPDNMECTRCPPNTVIEGFNPWGIESCTPCGEGLHTTDNIKCETNCKYTSPSGQLYDFTSLAMVQQVTGSHLFTSSGTQFYHIFNISLCGGSHNFPLVSCNDNITIPDDENKTNTTLDEEDSGVLLGESDVVNSVICRNTIIPPRMGGDPTALSVQPVSLGERLMKITTNISGLAIDQLKEIEGYKDTDADYDVHFLYNSSYPTPACPNGRSTTITLHCDAAQKGNGSLLLPPQCADGTCDGCNFHFVWLTQRGCPACQSGDYKQVVGKCIDGEEEVTNIPPKHCVILEDSKALTFKQACQETWPQWLSVIVWVIPVFVALSVLLIIILVYCWLRNRKLEYKYMKLVGAGSGQGGKDGELPAAETCGLDDDDDEEEEEDHFDNVQFRTTAPQSNTSKLFGKLKSSLSKREDNPFENIQLSEKEPLT